MSAGERARPGRRPLGVALGAVVLAALLIGILVERPSATARAHPAAPPLPVVDHVRLPASPGGAASDVGPSDLPDRLPRGHAAGLGEEDGIVPADTTVFDDRVPAVAKLDPALLGALRRAATDAARARVTFIVDSGWRSVRYQERLLQAAVVTYGSAAEAARWVATPDTSAHVSGQAVDIGPSNAAAWLARRGGLYGLCQIYRNEPWHYELRPRAATDGCPTMYADAAHDPRAQR